MFRASLEAKCPRLVALPADREIEKSQPRCWLARWECRPGISVAVFSA